MPDSWAELAITASLIQFAAQKLRAEINAMSNSFGSTRTGADWCIKALHGSEEAGEVLGIPDQSGCPSVMAAYTQMFSIAAPTAANWEGELYFFTDPVVMGSVYKRQIGSATTYSEVIPNTVWVTGTVPDGVGTFLTAVEQWRCVYYSVTVHLDATATTNSGNVVACQSVSKPIVIARGNSLASSGKMLSEQLCMYQAADTPEYVTASQMPNAFTGLASEGVYMPLKLDNNHQRWCSANTHSCLDASGWTKNATHDYTNKSATWVIADGLYPGLTGAWNNSADTYSWNGDVHLMPCTDTVGSICFANLNQAATLRVTIRAGYQYQVQPGTALASFQKPPIPFDREATDVYYAVSRRMKDAYPGEYNSLDKLWPVIRGIASTLGPLVRGIPVVGGALYGAGTAIGKAIDRKIARREAKKAATPQVVVVKTPAPPPAPRMPAGFLGKQWSGQPAAAPKITVIRRK